MSIKDRISKEKHRYRQLTGELPDRVYVGLNQFAELHSAKCENQVHGLEVFKVAAVNHLFLAGGIS